MAVRILEHQRYVKSSSHNGKLYWICQYHKKTDFNPVICKASVTTEMGRIVSTPAITINKLSYMR